MPPPRPRRRDSGSGSRLYILFDAFRLSQRLSPRHVPCHVRRHMPQCPHPQGSTRGALPVNWRRWAFSPAGIAILFIGAGILHFVRPARYAGIVPYMLPHPLLLVYVSGLAELAGGIGVLFPQTRIVAGRGLILLLIVVFPANVQMLVSARAAGAPHWFEAILWVRLPVQGLLIAWVWRATLHGEPRDKQQHATCTTA
jgi:uncharacterized membrane protein